MAQTQKGRHEQDEDDAPVVTTNATDNREQLAEDVDAILDDIDEVLETNAAEFVSQFVQKGGQ
jgi:ubiquitin-like protein Pup